MSELTVRQVLEMPVLRSAGPAVAAGSTGLDRSVRWVHSTELADIAPLLRGGDLVLSTGLALPDDATGAAEFASSLDSSQAAGLVIELGRRWHQLPETLVEAFDERGMPLIALHREVRFAAVAQVIGERIVDDQLRELRESEHVHETFTSLSVAEAGPDEVLETVQRLSGRPVVLENDQHRVMAYRAGQDDVTDFLDGWQARSRHVTTSARTGWDPDQGWLVTRLGRRERGWGRLVIQSPDRPTQRMITIAERAAAALAMHRLHDHQRLSAIRRTHHELVVGLLNDSSDPEVLRRCALVGFPTDRRHFTGLTLRLAAPVGAERGSAAGGADEVIATVVHAAEALRTPALVCLIESDIRIVLSTPPGSPSAVLADKLCAAVFRRHPVVAGAGRTVERSADIDRTLREAQQVTNALSETVPSDKVHRLEDLHLRGLLALLGDDDRLRLFAERELEPLRVHDDKHRTQLVDAVQALLQHPVSKSDAAASLHLSRPVFYDRIAKASRILGADLDDADVRVSLQVALMAASQFHAS